MWLRDWGLAGLQFGPSWFWVYIGFRVEPLNPKPTGFRLVQNASNPTDKSDLIPACEVLGVGT